jgi:hypothetical protein
LLQWWDHATTKIHTPVWWESRFPFGTLSAVVTYIEIWFSSVLLLLTFTTAWALAQLAPARRAFPISIAVALFAGLYLKMGLLVRLSYFDFVLRFLVLLRLGEIAIALPIFVFLLSRQRTIAALNG